VTDERLAEAARILAGRREQETPEPTSLRIARVRRMPSDAAPVMQPDSRPLIEGAVDVRVAERGNASRWWRAALAHDGRDLAFMVQVADPTPWQNGEGRFTHGFIGGDGVDLQLEVPGRGAIRLFTAPLAGKPVAAYWQAKAEAADNAVTYMVANNPANAASFDLVKRIDNATVKTAVGFNAYTVLVRVPLAELGLNAALGQDVKGQAGVIYSDPSGTRRAARLYWHNKNTGLVSDVPSEARLEPRHWGPITIDK
jgi:hypothetical protein